jgi:hypothetical protein
VGLSSDRLLGIDKRFVDFRRKPKEQLTEEDKNEGVRVLLMPHHAVKRLRLIFPLRQIIPYMPELLWRNSDILNRNNTVPPLQPS